MPAAPKMPLLAVLFCAAAFVVVIYQLIIRIINFPFAAIFHLINAKVIYMGASVPSLLFSIVFPASRLAVIFPAVPNACTIPD